MKIFLILFLFIQLSCASSSKIGQAKNFSYDSISSFKIGEATESDVISLLGKPFLNREKDDCYTLLFRDPNTNFHRVSVNFSYKTKKVIGLLWIPTPGEKEFSLDGAQSHFSNIHFEKFQTEMKGHTVSQGNISYIDKYNGITIGYNPNNKIVEGIAFFEREDRAPTNIKK